MTNILLFGKSGYNIEEVIKNFSAACFMSGLEVQSDFEKAEQTEAPITGYIKVQKEKITDKDMPQKADFILITDSEAVKKLKEKDGQVISAVEIDRKITKSQRIEGSSTGYLCGSLAKATKLTTLKTMRKVLDDKDVDEGFKAIK